ncbi:MAG: PDGLE domain-containing protein [Firmicutes bacterium]|nr:PDGLE domain-containing protein [Bacillota bacterium]
MNRWIWIGLGVALVLAVFVSPFASQDPDGLERVAEDLGFSGYAWGNPVFNSPIPDYTMPGVKSQALATGLAGLAGTLLVFILAVLLGKYLKSRKEPGSRV